MDAQIVPPSPQGTGGMCFLGRVMAAYLIVDVDDLLEHFRRRGISVDLQELAVGLRGGAALAAGLISADRLKAVAAANWSNHKRARSGIDTQYVFKAAGYEIFDIPRRSSLPTCRISLPRTMKTTISARLVA